MKRAKVKTATFGLLKSNKYSVKGAKLAALIKFDIKDAKHKTQKSKSIEIC